MQDFIRIGGPITSAPLNEDFRRLLNAISIANTNLVFPEENAVVNTISDMMAIINPDDAQACYVVSSGEFYRYSKTDNKNITAHPAAVYQKVNLSTFFMSLPLQAQIMTTARRISFLPVYP